MKKDLNKVEELLLVVDMVNGFVIEGPMADPYIQHIIPAIRREMVNFINDDTKDVVVIKEGHNKGAVEFNSYPEHCVKGTKEAELCPELLDLEKYCHTVSKNSTSAIWADGFMDLVKQMINKKLKKVVITGCCTDICVINLAIPLKMFFNQFNIDVEVIVYENAVETFNIPGVHERDEWNQMAMKFLQQAGIKIYNSDYLLLDKVLKESGIDQRYYEINGQSEQKVNLLKENGIYKVFTMEKGNRFEEEEFETFEEAARRLIQYMANDQEEQNNMINKFNTEMSLGYQKVKVNN